MLKFSLALFVRNVPREKRAQCVYLLVTQKRGKRAPLNKVNFVILLTSIDRLQKG